MLTLFIQSAKSQGLYNLFLLGSIMTRVLLVNYVEGNGSRHGLPRCNLHKSYGIRSPDKIGIQSNMPTTINVQV